MRKRIFAVCDLEESYACSLTDYLNEKKSTPFEVQAFTNVESLQAFAREHEIEILLISTRAMCNEIRELPVARTIILSEGEPLQGLRSIRLAISTSRPTRFSRRCWSIMPSCIRLRMFPRCVPGGRGFTACIPRSDARGRRRLR